MPDDGRRGPDPGLRRRGRPTPDRGGRPTRRRRSQHRDRGAPAEARPAARHVREVAPRPGRGEGIRSVGRRRRRHQIERHGRSRRGARRTVTGVPRLALRGLRHPHHRPIPAAVPRASAGQPLCPPRRIRRHEGRGTRTGLPARRVRTVGPFELPGSRSGPRQSADGDDTTGGDRAAGSCRRCPGLDAIHLVTADARHGSRDRARAFPSWPWAAAVASP